MTTIKSNAATVRPRHSFHVSILLHLFPGALAVMVYLATAPLALRRGLPPMLVLSVVALVVLAPVELGHLLIAARRRAGSWSLGSVISFPTPLGAWRYILIVSGLVVLSIAFYALSAPADAWFSHRFMGWLPSWFFYSDLKQYARYSHGVLALTLAVRFVADVVVVAAIEELYFRGYLLPRIPGPAWLAPVLSAGLFAVYHFWQPYNWPSIFCLMLPTAFAVWRFKDVRIGVYTHVTLNLVGFITTAIAFARL
jgi:membrane protease YdiL (CAAX protease family)